MKKLLAVLALTALATGCTDATIGAYGSYGSRGHATCYSGGKVTFNAISTGRVKDQENSDGFSAKWQDVGSDGKPQGSVYYATVSGQCIIKYLD